jgi:hypothetical protein
MPDLYQLFRQLPTNDEWRTIPNFPMYEMTRCGKVRRHLVMHILRPNRRHRKDGDPTFNLRTSEENYAFHAVTLSSLLKATFGDTLSVFTSS